MDCSTPSSLSFAVSWSLLKLMFIELVMLSNHLILCHLLLLLPSIFLSMSLHQVAKVLELYNEYLGWIFFRTDWFDLLEVQGTLRVFSNATVQKHQFIGIQLSL